MLHLQRHEPNGRGPQKSKENSWRENRAGLFEERLKELGLPYRRGVYRRESAIFRHSIPRGKRLIQVEPKEERIRGKYFFHISEGQNK